MATNIQYTLAQRPEGYPDDTTWKRLEEAVPTPGAGEVLVRNIYVSLDPAMRGWLNDAKSYIPPVQIGEVMRAICVGIVEASNHDKFAVGTHVVGMGGVQQYWLTNGEGLRAVDGSRAPLPLFISTLGMTGFTAYFGLLNVGQPKEGETVLVSAAAGAVGSVVGQVAKIKGCHVVGIAGGPEKCAYVKDELGFDECIDYKGKDMASMAAAIKATCPKGVDVYFDNVGGDILDAALTRINMYARIVVCGAISQYNATTPIQGPSNYLSLLVNRARMEGMVVMDYAKDYGKAIQDMGGWIMQGKLKSKEFIVEGIDTFPETLLRLFNGDKTGKLILQVTDK